ncbi:MAG: hypothetical protein HY052_08620 [Proteobacteria bacterium]|nr:hypothetical protein [Pseudomonadota bacterium]
MHDPGVDREKQLQFEKDETAFKALSPKLQRVADVVAGTGFRGRTVVGVASKAVLSVVDLAFNVLFRFPYILLKRLVTVAANKMVDGVKLAIKGGAAAALVFGGRKNAAARRERALAWEKNTVMKIDKAWRDTKLGLSNAGRKALGFAEYYGALGLYRGTQWLLNPRTSSGKPLFGDETINKVIGTTVAAGLFLFLSIELTKVAVMAKIWHLKFARSLLTDKSPLYVRLLKQAAFHPLLTAGLTAVKFVTLPVIAASRQALKSTKLTQAVAYRYNVRLRARENHQQTKRPALAFAVPIFSFAKKFMAHIIEKSSPEFYTARLQHYQELRMPSQTTGTPRVGQMELGDAFNTAQGPARQQKPPVSDISVKPTPHNR